MGPTAAVAQQRPLVTEDPETVGAGVVLLETGFDYRRGEQFPVSGLEGNLWRVPTLGFSIGYGSNAEVQIDGGLYSHLSITERFDAPLSGMLDFDGDSTSSIEDMYIGTKVRLLGETARRPAFGMRFATKLPNASNESGLGLDTMDYFSSLLVGKTIQSVRVVGNIGLGILSDPTRGDRQNGVVIYGVSLARAVAQGLEVVGEINGRHDTRSGTPPPGTESRAMMRFGTRYTRGTARVDVAVLVGVTKDDPTVGVTAGLTYVFQAFQVP
jgi:hypothetical protein|tara:strand:+ start:2322 stop:3128 length:807 start_codon:yes stop_codon:yes gene_type:complete